MVGGGIIMIGIRLLNFIFMRLLLKIYFSGGLEFCVGNCNYDLLLQNPSRYRNEFRITGYNEAE